MIGYLDSNGFTPNTVSVSGIPWSTYDVILYFNGDIGTATRLANYRVTNADTSGHIRGCSGAGLEGSTVSGADATNFAGTYIRASNNSVGNYVEFLGCSGPELHIAPVHGQSTDGQVRASINGLQILTRQ